MGEPQEGTADVLEHERLGPVLVKKRTILEIQTPRHFGLREVLMGQIVAFLVTGLFFASLVTLIVGAYVTDHFARESISTALLVGAIRLNAIGIALSLLGLFILLLPCVMANGYIVYLVRNHNPQYKRPDSQFVVQIRFCPRIHTGLRGRLDDADDIGLLVFLDDRFCFHGDHIRISMPYAAITAISTRNVGLAGGWICGQRIRVHSPDLLIWQHIEFLERQSWQVFASRRMATQIQDMFSIKRGEHLLLLR